MSKVAVQITPAAVLIGVGVLVAAYTVWRTGKAVGGVIDWVAAIPERIVESAKEGGRVFLDQQIPNEINRVNTPGSYEPVYSDSLKNDDGMDFRYF